MVKSCTICGRRAPGGVCPEHGSPESRRHARGSDHGRNTRYWRELRRARLDLDGHVCQLRVDEGCTEVATTVHLDPKLGGDHLRATITDVTSACAHCHGVVDGGRAQDGPAEPEGTVVRGPWLV